MERPRTAALRRVRRRRGARGDAGLGVSASRVERWWSERPRRRPEAYACELARAKFWRDDRRFVATFPDLDDVAALLELDSEFAHAFVLVLSQLPTAVRTALAADFYTQRKSRAETDLDSDRARLAAAARVALLVAGLAERPAIEDERLRDLLHGAAQGDDLSETPETVFFELSDTVAKLRVELARADPNEPASAASTAVIETIDPSSGLVDLREILVRSAWAAARSWEPPRVLEFLVRADQALPA